MTKTSLLLVGIVAILVLLVVAGFALRQRKQTTLQVQSTTPSAPPEQPKTQSMPRESDYPTRATVYRNTTVGFEMVFPKGWNVQSSNDGHSYNTCTSVDTCNQVLTDAAEEGRSWYGCTNKQCSVAVLITEANYLLTDGYDQIYRGLKADKLNPQKLENSIPGARVIKSSAEFASWQDAYYVFFEKSNKAFSILVAGGNEEKLRQVISSFKLIQ